MCNRRIADRAATIVGGMIESLDILGRYDCTITRASEFWELDELWSLVGNKGICGQGRERPTMAGAANGWPSLRLLLSSEMSVAQELLPLGYRNRPIYYTDFRDSYSTFHLQTRSAHRQGDQRYCRYRTLQQHVAPHGEHLAQTAPSNNREHSSYLAHYGLIGGQCQDHSCTPLAT